MKNGTRLGAQVSRKVGDAGPGNDGARYTGAGNREWRACGAARRWGRTGWGEEYRRWKLIMASAVQPGDRGGLEGAETQGSRGMRIRSSTGVFDAEYRFRVAEPSDRDRSAALA